MLFHLKSILSHISRRVHSHAISTTALIHSESDPHPVVIVVKFSHCLGTITAVHPAENIDCLRSLSFTAFTLSSLGFSDSFLCFCFSCLWYLPSSSSSGLPQPSHGCPERKVAWCWSLLLVWCHLFSFSKLCLQSGPPSFCCGLCCPSNYLLYFMVFLKKRSYHCFFSLYIRFSLLTLLSCYLWSNLWYIFFFCKSISVETRQLRKKKQSKHLTSELVFWRLPQIVLQASIQVIWIY